MSLLAYPLYIRKAWAVQQVFVQLGFEPADLYVGVREVVGIGPNVLLVELRTQGKSFIYTIARLGPLSEDGVLAQWSSFVERANGENATELQAVFQSVPLDLDHLVGLVGALYQRGFVCPALPDPGNGRELLGQLFGPTHIFGVNSTGGKA